MDSSQEASRRGEETEAAWAHATTFDEVCELTAQYVDGRTPYSPWYRGPLDEESNPLVPYLVGLCESGFATVSSQPGVMDTNYRQRAFVDGIASKSV
jgi:hypothetical protein